MSTKPTRNELTRRCLGAERPTAHSSGPDAPVREPDERDRGRAATAGATVLAPAERSAPRPPRALVVGVVGFVLVFGVLGYAWRGNVAGLSVSPGEVTSTATSDSAGNAISREQIDSMVATLLERLKQQPDDAEGWSMLARLYALVGRDSQASEAYRKVAELRPKDAQALADLANSLAVANGGNFDGESERLALEAVNLDPRNLKALALAGAVTMSKGDFEGAVGYWQRAADLGEPGSDLARRLQAAADEARQRARYAGNPGAAVATAVPAANAVAGRVRLGAGLHGQVAPGDTLFIFARAAAGSKVPLAVLRKQASDLPLEFTLDDSLAMSPAAKLSAAAEVVIGARISKSGSATPQPGDFHALSAPVSVGTRGVDLEINEVVR